MLFCPNQTFSYEYIAAKASLSLQYCHKIPGHGVKVGPGPQDPGNRDPPQSLKVGPGTPLKFKSGTPGPPSKFKSATPRPLQSGTPSPFFNEFFFFRIFIRFFYLFNFVSFSNKIQKNINCE